MNPLQIEDRGLLIPPEYLAGISRQVRVRPIRGGIVVESADQAEARDAPHSMVERLRAVAADHVPEIAGLVDDIPDETLLALKLSDDAAAAEITLRAWSFVFRRGSTAGGSSTGAVPEQAGRLRCGHLLPLQGRTKATDPPCVMSSATPRRSSICTNSGAWTCYQTWCRGSWFRRRWPPNWPKAGGLAWICRCLRTSPGRICVKPPSRRSYRWSRRSAPAKRLCLAHRHVPKGTRRCDSLPKISPPSAVWFRLFGISVGRHIYKLHDVMTICRAS